jgi:NifU-like protein involved in Fe-S cluster formation
LNLNLKVNNRYDKEMLRVIGGAIKRIVPRAISRTGYSERVIDHFENPRNVGSLDKNDKNVGTGLVGAPACFTGDTIIAVADGRRQATLDSLTEDIPVWSYNINEKKYEIKMARRVYSGEKHVWKVTFDDESSVTCTEDHEFLMRPNFEYKGNKHIKSHESIAPFRRTVNKRGYWTIERMGSRQSVKVTEYLQIWKFHNPGICVEGHNIHHKDFSKDNDCLDNLERMTIAEHIIVHPPDTYYYDCSVYSREDIQTALVEKYNHKIIDREYIGVLPTYTLQVEENNNYVVLTKITMNTQCGIIVRNCGDVIKLQIHVDPETKIIDEVRFKTFGCGSAQAASSITTEWIKGQLVDTCVVSNMAISKHLNLPPQKNHCSALSEEAVAMAIADYKGKNEPK